MAGVGLGLPHGDAAVPQTSTPVPIGKALMFSDEYRPGAQFRVVSPVIDESPDIEAVQNQAIWAEADTRIVEYLNTNERVSLFPIEQADIQQGTVYELSSSTLSIFDRNEGIVSCEYHLPDESADAEQLRADDASGGGGKALITANNFYPEARFRIISDVLGWTPSGASRGDDNYSGYTTRYGEYVNANDEFLFYPARSAAVERGVYRMRGVFDVVDSGEALLSVGFDRVGGSRWD